MTFPYELRIFDNQRMVHARQLTGPVELGRQREAEGEPAPYHFDDRANPPRLVFARSGELDIGRFQLRLEPLASGLIRLENVNNRVRIRLTSGEELAPGTSREVLLPVVFSVGRKTIRLLSVPEESDSPLQTLAAPTIAPFALTGATSQLATMALSGRAGVGTDTLVRCLEVTLEVLRSAATSDEFFARAARATAELVRLDCVRVLLLEDDVWKVRATHPGPAAPTAGATWEPSRRILARAAQERRTFWQMSAGDEHESSLHNVGAIVAAPILGRGGEVIGVIYGERRFRGDRGMSQGLSEVEALLVELLAGGVAAGLARLEQEQEALRARVQFEQFFTRELARQLAANPDLLRGRDTAVTVLFCDIRGFSRYSERLGPLRTVELIGDALSVLSECVLEQNGVVVDYIGDELMGMWGAPEEQPDHAARACRAAQAMVARLPVLNERWQAVLGESLDVGVGINSGVALVGNVGTSSRRKYGALGNTVNLASRVQGATKYLKTRLLATGATRAQLGNEFACRRLCQARVVNIAGSVELFELMPPMQGEMLEQYETALAQFDAQRFHTAVRLLGNVLNEHPDDGPSLVLLSRAVDGLVRGASEGHPVWELPGK